MSPTDTQTKILHGPAASSPLPLFEAYPGRSLTLGTATLTWASSGCSLYQAAVSPVMLQLYALQHLPVTQPLLLSGCSQPPLSTSLPPSPFIQVCQVPACRSPQCSERGALSTRHRRASQVSDTSLGWGGGGPPGTPAQGQVVPPTWLCPDTLQLEGATGRGQLSEHSRAFRNNILEVGGVGSTQSLGRCVPVLGEGILPRAQGSSSGAKGLPRSTASAISL